MQAAHALGVVHRDLKPANVMLVSLDGEDEVVKILDFGVAKLTRAEDQANLTQAGALLGTLPYMAPEQILSKPVDARTDVYALGVVLYRMLAGAPLFDADSLSDVVRNQVQTPAPPFSTRVPGLSVPAPIEAAVLRCHEKDPRKRFASMAELDAALGRALDGTAEPSGASAIKGRKIEETLPTGTRLPAAAQTALLPLADETRSAFVEVQKEPEVALADASVFDAAPSTEPDAVAPTTRRILPIAAVLAVVVAAVAVAVAVVLVLLVTPERNPTAVSPSTPPVAVPAPSTPPVAVPAPSTPPVAVPAPSTPPVVLPVQPAAVELIEDELAEAKPVEDKPVEDKPVEDKAKPAPNKPAAVKPVPKKPLAVPVEPEAPSGFRRVLTKEGG
jgi:serine/threonine-protein kinase